MDHGLASESVSTLVLLLATVILVAVASKYIRIPYTIALTIAGLLIVLSGIKLQINLTPDLILFIFLLALLFESSYNLPFGEVRDNLRPIALLAVPGVILTAVCVAGGLYFWTGWGRIRHSCSGRSCRPRILCRCWRYSARSARLAACR